MQMNNYDVLEGFEATLFRIGILDEKTWREDKWFWLLHNYWNKD